MSSSQINPKHFFEEFEKPQNAESLLTNLNEKSNHNKLSLADFIIFLFKNNILRNNEQLALSLTLFLIVEANHFHNHFSLLASILIERESLLCLFLLKELCVEGNLALYKEAMIQDLEKVV